MTFKVFTQQMLERSPTYFFSYDAFYARALDMGVWLFYCRIERGSSLLCTQILVPYTIILYVHAHYVIICNDQLIIGRSWTKVSNGSFEVIKKDCAGCILKFIRCL